MNEKDVAQLRRRINPDKCNIGHIRGCYVNEKREIISQFNSSLGLMPVEQNEKILAVLKKTLSGAVGRNLIDISFTNNQVLEGEEYSLLARLRSSSLGDDDAVSAFFAKVAESLDMESAYLLMLTHDNYDVVSHRSDGGEDEESVSMFSYILCTICPIKETKPALSFYVHENKFRSLCEEQIIGAPELGFMFPAFDGGKANIYNALYYTRNTSQNHSEFSDAVFHTELPMPAAAQKETFRSVLSESVSDACSYDVAVAVHDKLYDMVEEHKTEKNPEVQTVTKSSLKKVLEDAGVPEVKLEAFEEKYDEQFGANTGISTQNITDVKQLEVKTPEVTIRVAPERSDLVRTQIIDGVKYILVRADGEVEVNGVNIRIKD